MTYYQCVRPLAASFSKLNLKRNPFVISSGKYHIGNRPSPISVKHISITRLYPFRHNYGIVCWARHTWWYAASVTTNVVHICITVPLFTPGRPTSTLNALRQRQHVRHVADSICKFIFWYENFRISIQIYISVSNDPINDKLTFVPIMARCLTDHYWNQYILLEHMCVTRFKWVKA